MLTGLQKGQWYDLVLALADVIHDQPIWYLFQGYSNVSVQKNGFCYNFVFPVALSKPTKVCQVLTVLLDPIRFC